MPVNIKDVAKEAKVSMSTVSRVINNNYPVKEETRKRVEAAIEKLKFSPNVLARALINQNTKTIGVLVPRIDNLFFPTVIKAVETSLKDSGYSIYLCDTGDKADQEVMYINSLMARQVDGIISIDPKTENIKSGFYEDVSKDLPLVCINGYNKNIKCNFVLNDQESGTRQAINYLLELGHKNIIFVKGRKSYSYDLKKDVYIDILKEHKLLKNKHIVDVGQGNSYETVYVTMDIMIKELKNVSLPTAVFACNDLMALGVLNACKRLNYEVPKDVSIIGFDNIVISSLVEPQITTVDQNMYRLGESAAKMLLDVIKDENQQTSIIRLNTKLITRDSCRRV
ncbi:LacI family DNA-binding transcriptional regulator [Clostridium neuense]|uniref:LacI family DNA-binding transcriptional regulator n=1 Tax=Clostridium neuense TaxID=1728934 RepID=A0ABW8TN44_9CLOT